MEKSPMIFNADLTVVLKPPLVNMSYVTMNNRGGRIRADVDLVITANPKENAERNSQYVFLCIEKAYAK